MEIFITPEETKRILDTAHELREKFQKRGKTPKVFICTYGCQQNEADSERLTGLAEECGYIETNTENEADLIIVNTCAIREHAELKTLSVTGGYKKLKEKNPELLIMLCGCMAQEKHIRDRLYKSYPYVDAIFGTDSGYKLPVIIRDALQSEKRLSFVNDLPHEEFGIIAEDLPTKRTSPYRAWLSIMYGCNNYCTYCVVPYVRGRERSRNSKNIIEEAKSLISSGAKEITLLGQNVNSYRGDLTFPELLEKIDSLDGDFVLRFMTSHPKDCSKELIDVMAAGKHIAPQFHLPVQSGNTEILRRMNRRYTREEYLEKVAYIREKLPNASLTTDIIVGFPGETDEQFEDTLSLVKSVKYDMLYTFIYSPRPGTAAADMPCRVPHEECVRRFTLLSDAENEIALSLNENLVGKTEKVLSDGLTGRTGQNKIVNFDKPAEKGIFVNAKITSAHPYALDGKTEL